MVTNGPQEAGSPLKLNLKLDLKSKGPSDGVPDKRYEKCNNASKMSIAPNQENGGNNSLSPPITIRDIQDQDSG